MTRFTGRGLGLPAAFGVIRAHHGWIDVASEPGRGTTVRLILPAVPAGTGRVELIDPLEETAAPPEPPAPSEPPG